MDIFTDGKKECNFIEGKIILIDKPLEWTSFDVVNKIRYLLKSYHNVKKIKVGHAGTLDPLATGLLIVCTGKYTKRIEEIQTLHKEYLTTIKLGATTPSFDRETEEDEQFPTDHITSELLKKQCSEHIGEQLQVPPIFSAKKVNGKKAYEAAREGKSIELKPNKITINNIDIIEYTSPYLKLKINCSKGTYIRSMARDIGKSLNTGGYLQDLRRTKIGIYDVQNAMTITEFEEKIKNLKPIQNYNV